MKRLIVTCSLFLIAFAAGVIANAGLPIWVSSPVAFVSGFVFSTIRKIEMTTTPSEATK